MWATLEIQQIVLDKYAQYCMFQYVHTFKFFQTSEKKNEMIVDMYFVNKSAFVVMLTN